MVDDPPEERRKSKLLGVNRPVRMPQKNPYGNYSRPPSAEETAVMTERGLLNAGQA